MVTDDTFLKFSGGINDNCLINVLNIKGHNNAVNEPQLIRQSSYYDNAKFALLADSNTNCFTILSTNIQSINSKFDELEAFVYYLSTINFKFSIICLQESCISENDDLSQIQLNGYVCIPQGKSCSTKGGLIIYVEQSFDYELTMSINTAKNWEGQIVQITGGGLSQSITIGNIYRPPRPSHDNYKEFIAELSTVISTLKECGKKNIILAGDYNINILKVNEQDFCSTFFDTLTSFSLFPLITLPTRFSRHNGTLIDNFFCEYTKFTSDSVAGIFINKLSDHQPYFMIMDTKLKKIHPPKFTRINVQHMAAMVKVRKEISAANLYNKLDKSAIADTNLNYDIIDHEINLAKNKHMTSKLVKFKKHKHKISQWITQGILRSIRFRDHLYKHMKSVNPNYPEYDALKSKLKTFNNILKRSIRVAKRIYYEACFSNFKHDLKNTWKTINAILSTRKPNKSFPTLFKEAGETITDPIAIVNRFNIFFTNIGPNLAKKIVYNGNKTHKSYLNNNTPNVFTFTRIETDTISKTIQNLSAKNSSGPDGLSTKLLKVIEPELTKSLTLLVNQVLNTGIFPDKLKIAKVIPILKKGNQTIFNNYRPISLLPAISKVIEKIIFNQLSTYLEESQILDGSQYGFRRNRSTEYAALEVIDRIITKMDNNKIPINIYLDLSKAFDTIDHSILIDKLQFYGIKGTNLNLFHSYLTNRKQYTEIDDLKSSILPIQTGVPQGSILGPLLFILYINDFPQASKLFDFIMYADDTTLASTLDKFTESNNNMELCDSINSELVKINEWLTINKLSINTSKSKYMTFSFQKNFAHDLDLKIDNLRIERVHEFNFLGIIIDTQLNWAKHTGKIANSCSQKIGVLNKLKHVLPLQIKIMLYNSLILPHINYGLMLWGFQTHRIFTLQKKALRIITLSGYLSHTGALYKANNMLKVDDILILQQLKFYFKYLNKTLPAYLQSWSIISNAAIHNHDTRTKSELSLYRAKHEFAKKCLRHNLPLTLNNTPSIIKDKLHTHSLQGFANYAKHQFIMEYQDTCTRVNCYVCARYPQ